MKQLLISFFLISCLQACQKPNKIEGIVVIGGGLMGSSTAWQLSREGENVLLIEQQDSIYTFGSSFGEARISRSLGPKGDIFSFLQQESVAETQKLIDFLQTSDTHGTHAMEDIYRTSPVTYLYYQSQKKTIDTLLEGQQDRYEFAPNALSAKTKFGMHVPDSVMVIREYKEFSGTLNPKVLISKLHQGIKVSGSRVRYNQKVKCLKRNKGIFEIDIQDTQTGKMRKVLARKVVAAAGPYNGSLLKNIAPYVEELIIPKRLFLSFLRIKKEVHDQLSQNQKARIRQFYPIADISPEIYYSMIENYDEIGAPIIKVGGHLLRTDIEDLDEVWNTNLKEEEIRWSMENTARYLSMLDLPIGPGDLEFSRGYSCVYSLTRSEVPYVSHLVKENGELDRLCILVGGMSGVGAKGALAYGRIAADLLLDRTDKRDNYQKVKSALGSKRFMQDIETLEEQ